MGKLKEVIDQLADDFENGRQLSSAGEECKDLFTEDWEQVLQSAEDTEELLTIDDAAALLGVSKQSLRNWEKEGKLVPSARTAGNHRRYTRSQINQMRGKQMNTNDILLHGMQVAKLRDLVDRLLGGFEPDEKVNITVKQDHLEKKVVLLIETEDGNSAISKTFKMED